MMTGLKSVLVHCVCVTACKRPDTPRQRGSFVSETVDEPITRARGQPRICRGESEAVGPTRSSLRVTTLPGEVLLRFTLGGRVKPSHVRVRGMDGSGLRREWTVRGKRVNLDLCSLVGRREGRFAPGCEKHTAWWTAPLGKDEATLYSWTVDQLAHCTHSTVCTAYNIGRIVMELTAGADLAIYTERSTSARG